MARTAVVTGATDGIGFATAKALASMGLDVIGVGRSEARCAASAEAIRRACGKSVEFVAGDLSTASGVRGIAAELRRALGRSGGCLDVLVNAAGAVSSRRAESADGRELQLAVNHLAPFLLTRELIPCLKEAESARVLVVGSRSHRHARIDWDDVMMRRGYSLLAAYKRSKLCAVAFSTELSRRLFFSSISVFAIDPGLVRTDIGLKGTHGLEKLAWRLRRIFGSSPDVPAQYMATIATDPAYAGKTGLYLRRGRRIKPDPLARDPESCGRIWALSERLCGIEKRYFSLWRKGPLGCEGPAPTTKAASDGEPEERAAPRREGRNRDGIDGRPRPDRPSRSAVVCAFNEEATVASVIDGLLAARCVDEVVVVDDGSSDGTAQAIRRYEGTEGFRAVYVAPNRGKGNAMAEGVSVARGDVILFVDADLVNWTGEYAESVLEPLLSGAADMSIGYPYRESLFWDRFDPFRLQRWIAGERAVWRSDILPLLPAMRSSRYGVETLINMYYKTRHRPVRFVRLEGLVHPIKFEKAPGPRAWKGYAEEAAHILGTLARHPLYTIMSTFPDLIDARNLALALMALFIRR